jgi:4-hydroxy-tetrahydrodipicolinate reductase
MVDCLAMATAVYLHGKNGRMGRVISGLIQKNSAFTLSDHLAACDVVIDFSSPAALPTLLKAQKPLVIGTTGYGEEEKKMVQEASKLIPIFAAPNFSLGMMLLQQMVQELSERVDDDVSIEVVEAHHKDKKDKPSGSALALARETGRNVPIHSIRAGDIVGDHAVIFGFDGERLELKHQVHSREAFAKGALKAAQFLKSQLPGYYTMKDLSYASCLSKRFFSGLRSASHYHLRAMRD